MKTIPQITEAQAKRCVTHYMCDCWQYKCQQMENALKDIYRWIESQGPDDEKFLLEDFEDLVKKALGMWDVEGEIK